jgi:hypothetical protein
MDTFQKHFGDIRSRLAEPATPVTFFRVCKALALMWEEDSERVNAEVVPYLDAHRHHWPDEMRVHPAFWEKLWLGDELVRFGPLCLISRLDLSYRKLGALAVERITNAPGLETLDALDLRSNDLDDAMLEALASTESLAALSELDMGDNPLVNPSGLLGMKNLRVLKLMHTEVDDTFLEALAERDALQLEELWLTRTKITLGGLRTLVTARALGHLRRLDITGVEGDLDLEFEVEAEISERWPDLDLTRGR